jgi:CHAT domain-containing protein/tetratricopeptide (TPR) repeat protein
MGKHTNHQSELWKATFKWSQRSLIVFLSLVLFAESGASLSKNQVEKPPVMLTQGRLDKADRLSAEAWQLYEKRTEESLRQAILLWQKALKLYRPEDNNNKSWRGRSLFYWGARTNLNIGLAYQKLKNYQEAFKSYNIAQILFSVWDNDVEQEFKAESTRQSRIGRAYTRKQMAFASKEISRFGQALEFYQAALSNHQNLCSEDPKQCDQDELVELLTDISETFYELGDSESGDNYLKQARDLLPKLQDGQSKFSLFLRIGAILIETRDQEGDDVKEKEGFDYMSEGLSFLLKNNNVPVSAQVYRVIAQRRATLESWSSQQKVDYYLKFVLPWVQKGGSDRGLSIAYKDLGEIYLEIDLNQAVYYFNKAKNTLRETPSLDIIADIHYGIAKALTRQKSFEKALREINQSISIAESVRDQVESRDLRTSYFSTTQKYYESKIAILVRLEDASDIGDKIELRLRAFNVSEQARSRTFLGLLDRSSAKFDLKSIEPSLRREVERLQMDLSKLEKQINISVSPEEKGKLEQQYIELFRQLDSLTNKIRPKTFSPADVPKDTPPQIVVGPDTKTKLKNIYLGALPKNSTLLQYYLGETESYLFEIIYLSDNKTGRIFLVPRIFILPGRREIEAAATSFYRQLKKRGSPQNIARSGACLRQKILPGNMIVGADKLVISADGILHKIPFSALPLPDSQKKKSISTREDEDACNEKAFSLGNNSNYIPLISQSEIINIPSISSIYQIRQRHYQPPTKILALLADPIFDVNDPRVTKRGSRLLCQNVLNEQSKQINHLNSGTNLSFDSDASLTRSGRGSLKSLPCTRTEAEAILTQVNESSQALSALDGDASQQWVMTSPLSQYRIVHFATHGDSNDQRPELSGLYLSRFNRKGQQLKDDFLSLSEIFNLKLSADLVVLSACQTGLGRNVRGEGMVGLTRGFMSAGAKRVIASLWNVDDGSTAQLMTSLYRKMLKEGLSPAVALRQTQIAMWKNQRNPYEWSAFQFYGEWEK